MLSRAFGLRVFSGLGDLGYFLPLDSRSFSPDTLLSMGFFLNSLQEDWAVSGQVELMFFSSWIFFARKDTFSLLISRLDAEPCLLLMDFLTEDFLLTLGATSKLLSLLDMIIGMGLYSSLKETLYSPSSPFLIFDTLLSEVFSLN